MSEYIHDMAAGYICTMSILKEGFLLKEGASVCIDCVSMPSTINCIMPQWYCLQSLFLAVNYFFVI